ncbi:hypothetical protein [Kitasatospora sp. GAS204B]|uniref:hypothetical protein n=1 Tax=unclassified Kitasatospora TaxID=2633591 RepID=UPI0024739541|nr:hypothetical protein [Kitasatospora sp. GAS204B]MDH6121800.1 Ca2+/Na+ antiporter [Kitasatospora sp. GAS204B]
MVLFLFIVIVAILLGIVGAVVHGLIFLLVIGAVLLVADVVYIAVRSSHSRRSLR